MFRPGFSRRQKPVHGPRRPPCMHAPSRYPRVFIHAPTCTPYDCKTFITMRFNYIYTYVRCGGGEHARIVCIHVPAECGARARAGAGPYATAPPARDYRRRRRRRPGTMWRIVRPSSPPPLHIPSCPARGARPSVEMCPYVRSR